MALARVGYLGPEGSFCHEAVSTLADVEAVACDTFADLLSSVADGTLDQGVVPIDGARLADSLQRYFENSEQLPTRLWLFADARGASGMLLQKLPGSPSADRGEAGGEAGDLEDTWRRAQLLGDTLTHEEMRSLADREILRRLFHEDDLRLFARMVGRFTASYDQVHAAVIAERAQREQAGRAQQAAHRSAAHH